MIYSNNIQVNRQRNFGKILLTIEVKTVFKSQIYLILIKFTQFSRQNSIVTWRRLQKSKFWISNKSKSRPVKGDEITRKMSDYESDDPLDFFNIAKPRKKVVKTYLFSYNSCLWDKPSNFLYFRYIRPGDKLRNNEMLWGECTCNYLRSTFE